MDWLIEIIALSNSVGFRRTCCRVVSCLAKVGVESSNLFARSNFPI